MSNFEVTTNQKASREKYRELIKWLYSVQTYFTETPKYKNITLRFNSNMTSWALISVLRVLRRALNRITWVWMDSSYDTQLYSELKQQLCVTWTQKLQTEFENID